MSARKVCAWISRHPPLAEQSKNLKDYRIIMINPPGRLWSAADAIALATNACKGWPDIFVVVMPLLMLKQFVEQVDGRAPVLRSIVHIEKNPPWIGHWEQVLSVKIDSKRWMPTKGQG